MSGKRYCSIRIFKTMKQSPTFIFEEGIKSIGQCKLDAGRDYEIDNRTIEVNMIFGGTFIEVSAIHLKSRNKVKAKLIFN